jgi:F-type H+-transporting ATPase subunit a
LSHPGADPFEQMLEEFDLNASGHHIFGLQIPDFLTHLHLGPLDISVNKVVVVMWMATFISFALIRYAGTGRGLVATGMRNLIESVFEFIKIDVVDSNLGKDGRKWLPFIGGLFFFILINNLLGLIPGGFSPASNLSVPAALAVVVFVVMVVVGMIKQGPFTFFKNLAPPGLPGWIYILMYPIEFLTLLAKPLSLTLRLFANILAGHIVIFSLLALIVLFGSYFIALLPLFAGTVMFAFEVFVAFIQAYIFAILSAMYIGSALHAEH